MYTYTNPKFIHTYVFKCKYIHIWYVYQSFKHQFLAFENFRDRISTFPFHRWPWPSEFRWPSFGRSVHVGTVGKHVSHTSPWDFGKVNLKVGKVNLKVGKVNLKVGKVNLKMGKVNLKVGIESYHFSYHSHSHILFGCNMCLPNPYSTFMRIN